MSAVVTEFVENTWKYMNSIKKYWDTQVWKMWLIDWQMRELWKSTYQGDPVGVERP